MEFDTLTFRTSDGLTLTGDVAVPTHYRGAAVVCHPHPLYGGDRFNPVVGALAKACFESGLATIRFDFRGVNQSEGTHDKGVGERQDALAALDAVLQYAGSGPVVMAGYSFGSMVALDVTHPRLDAWVAVAPPLGMREDDVASSHDPRPKRLLVPEHDQFSGPNDTRAKSAHWLSTSVQVIRMADHFLNGQLGEITDMTKAFVSGLGER